MPLQSCFRFSQLVAAQFQNNMSFLIPTRKAIGLDIGDSSIRAISLVEKHGGVFLSDYAMKALDEGYIKYGVVEKKDEVRAALAEILDTIIVKGDLPSFAVALPESRTFTKFIDLSDIGEADFQTRIVDEIRSNIPIDVENSYYDYQIVLYKDQNILHRGALLAVADKDIVAEYISLIESVGYNVTNLEVGAPALIRSIFPLNDETHYQQLNVVLDIGESRSILIAYRGGVILFVLSIPITGKGMDKVIAETLDMPIADARKARKRFGLNPNKANSHVRAILLQETEDLKKRIEQVQDFVRQHLQKQTKGMADAVGFKTIIDKILITGSASDLPGLKDVLDEAMDIEVAIADPLMNIFIEKNKTFPVKEVGSYSAAIGLALGLIKK